MKIVLGSDNMPIALWVVMQLIFTFRLDPTYTCLPCIMLTWLNSKSLSAFQKVFPKSCESYGYMFFQHSESFLQNRTTWSSETDLFENQDSCNLITHHYLQENGDSVGSNSTSTTFHLLLKWAKASWYAKVCQYNSK